MNFCRGYKVPPRSILNIRQIAEHVREVVGDPKNAMGQILEELLYSGTLDVVPNDDPRLARGVEAVYIPEDKCIRLRDCDYEACILGTRTRSMFTFWHEFGHLILGHERSFSREESQEHKAYEDSEWQANTFAGELLMPFTIIEAEGLILPEELTERFGVSFEAARIRLKQLKRI